MPFEASLSSSTDETISATTTSSRSIQLLKQRLSGFETEQGRLQGLAYVPLEKDEIVITTTPKAGTTWMQQICHQLRSARDCGGDMTFDEISRVVPWLELAVDQGQDLYAPQYGQERNCPRMFKTHAWENDCPSFPKTIVVLRRPEDVVVSFYKFFEGWFFDPGTIDLSSFAKEFWLARGVPSNKMQNASYFVHLISWYDRRHDPTVLFVCFEDLLEDLEGQVRRIARFISNDTYQYDQPDIVNVVVEKASYEFMKEHSSQFDEKLSKMARNEACGLPKDAGMNNGKIAEGKDRNGDVVLSDEIKEAIQRKWKDIVLPVTGCDNYDDLRNQLKTLQ
ncbi:sulfotransferase family protein [Nitzschia inconspicua]|uniref:Sulfotransferase family protein n=1 Tax=Nitzschia inconspicua TaxID=303405 RepID=A0A9K3KPH3_9STRA|nr:sulfotransferase family protein [Nitzschia inconspicua]